MDPTKTYIAIFCFVLLIFLYGCTAEEEQDIEKAIAAAAINQAKCKIGLGVNCSDTNITITLQNDTTNNQNTTSRSCRFDSDCSTFCEGTVFWKQGCDPRINACVKTFDTDCSQLSTTIGESSFPLRCTKYGCINNTEAIHNQKETLIGQANNYTAAMQQATQLRQIASKNCISALSDVTTQLIVNTALMYSIPSQVADLYSLTTQQIIDQLNNAASTRMSAEEYISLNCNAVRALDSDYRLLSQKRDRVMQQAQQYAGQ